ncbi:hypothetical protein LCGC14_1703580 [marine sediment metagenome]|uniref:Uncharacterized protein n=1 Tax=marine sediment metagenome TaxID=412755 RepID=A0A0F9HGY2_9ZZZZ
MDAEHMTALARAVVKDVFLFVRSTRREAMVRAVVASGHCNEDDSDERDANAVCHRADHVIAMLNA